MSGPYRRQPYTPLVPRLIHLNGPPGIGKSTLARRYADEHPGVLNLDIDQVRTMIGGWQQRFGQTGAQARTIALAMGAMHLEAGHDVVLPQYLGRLEQIERFEKMAAEARAAFVEVLLTDTRAAAISRFRRRGDDQQNPWHSQVREIVAASGGDVFLGEMYDRLSQVAASRPHAVAVLTRADEVDEAYAAMVAALE